MTRKSITAKQLRDIIDGWETLRAQADGLVLTDEQLRNVVDNPPVLKEYKKDARSLSGKLKTRVNAIHLAFDKRDTNPDLEQVIVDTNAEAVVQEMIDIGSKLDANIQAAFSGINKEEEPLSEDDDIVLDEVATEDEGLEGNTNVRDEEDRKPPLQGTSNSSNSFSVSTSVPINPASGVATIDRHSAAMFAQLQTLIQSNFSKAEVHAEQQHTATILEINKKVAAIDGTVTQKMNSFELRIANIEVKLGDTNISQPPTSRKPEYTYIAPPLVNGPYMPTATQRPMVTPPPQPQPRQTPAVQLQGDQIVNIMKTVPQHMLITSDGRHLFEQFNTQESRDDRLQYRGGMFVLQYEGKKDKFDGTGEYRTFWMRWLEKANQVCITDGEKLDLLRKSVDARIELTLDGYPMNAQGLYAAVLQLFDTYYQAAERQIRAMRAIVQLRPLNADYTELDTFFGILRKSATELKDNNCNEVHIKQQILKKFPPVVGESFMVKFPDSVSCMDLLDMVLQLQTHTRGFAARRMLDLFQYDTACMTTMCPFCREEGHRPTNCKKLTGTQAQWNIVIDTGRCYICLESDHNQSRCSANRCGSCGGTHHTKFHNVREGKVTPTATTSDHHSDSRGRSSSISRNNFNRSRNSFNNNRRDNTRSDNNTVSNNERNNTAKPISTPSHNAGSSQGYQQRHSGGGQTSSRRNETRTNTADAQWSDDTGTEEEEEAVELGEDGYPVIENACGLDFFRAGGEQDAEHNA